MNPKVDFFFTKAKTWQAEITKMRAIALDCGLSEELKWGCPCYTFDNRNIVLIHTFKEYCAYLFFKGALLNDASKILVQQTENVQSARQIRFTNLKEITAQEATIKAYIYEAIEVEKAGLKVEFRQSKELDLVDELVQAFKKKPALKKAFESLTPGRQRAYNLYFAAAKQTETRVARVEKYTKQILEGKGMND